MYMKFKLYKYKYATSTFGDLQTGGKKKWPPTINSEIIIRHNDLMLYGNVIKYIWNNTAVIVKLYSHPDFIDNTLSNSSKYNKGHILLLPTHKWSFNNSNNNNSNINNSNNINNTNIEMTPLAPSAKINITEDLKQEANNPYYIPLLNDNKIDFSEYLFDIKITDSSQDNIFKLDDDKKLLIKEKLKNFDDISQNDIKIIYNNTLSINNLITNPEDEIYEGNRMINSIKKDLDNLFPDLQYRINKGYIIISRKNLKTFDIVTQKHINKLDFFDWQYNKPIDYNTLKYVIFQNNYQNNIPINKLQQNEAEKILSLEYVIALQPKNDYVKWCVKRIIMMWYALDSFQIHLRKINILINLYRNDDKQLYNKKNGVLPTILIYPRYGVESIRTIISLLEYYFSLYIDNNNPNNSIYSNSRPSYFTKKNNLIYYTNGSTDLKSYLIESCKSDSCPNNFINNIFNNDITEFNTSKKVIVGSSSK